jgi:hypothetical protein
MGGLGVVLTASGANRRTLATTAPRAWESGQLGRRSLDERVERARQRRDELGDIDLSAARRETCQVEQHDGAHRVALDDHANVLPLYRPPHGDRILDGSRAVAMGNTGRAQIEGWGGERE